MVAEITICDKHFDIDGILFDKDGTLLDFSKLWVGWATSWMKELEVAYHETTGINVDQLAHNIGLDLAQKRWDPTGPLAIGSNNDLDALLSFSLYERGIPWNEALASVIHSRESVDASIDLTHCVQTVAGLQPFLDQLQTAQVSLGVVTSDDTERAKKQLGIAGIADYFDSIIGHDAVERGKPFPDMIWASFKRLNIRPERTLIIGDSNGDMILGKSTNLRASIGILPKQIETSDHLQEADCLIQDYKSINVL